MAMADQRIDFHEKLCELMNTRYVYYMPGSDVKMHFPCIRYELSSINSNYANNKNYINRVQYTLTLITDDPDTKYRERLMDFLKDYPYKYDRSYVSDNLVHDVFTVYLLRR